MSCVLLVDDEPAVLFTLSEVLTERGHRVLTARSGAEALTKLEEAETVITDLAMPKMDGLELDRLRAPRSRKIDCRGPTTAGSRIG
jgi:CheY-like chemotaxis protein